MKLLVLPGDGIGPEITSATLDVVRKADALFKLKLDLESREIGLKSLASEGTTLPEGVMKAIRAADGVVLGPLATYDYPAKEQGGLNPSAELRIGLDLYANVRPAKSRLGVGLTGKPVDLVIYRENTEGFYADRNMFQGIGEFMPTEDMALSIRKVTARACERIARRAFEAALRRRKKVTAVHKANVLKLSDGLFLREVRKVARDFPGVELEEIIVDAMAALLLRDPMRFDVVVTENMYGDILSDEASELSGGLGLGGSINAGDEHCVAQAQHGSAPDIAGKGIANPASLILSVAMLLEWLGARHRKENLQTAAKSMEAAVDAVLKDPSGRTRDLGGKLSTRSSRRQWLRIFDRNSWARSERGVPKKSSFFASSTILPASMKMTRCATLRAKPISWVTTIMVMPSLASWTMTSSTSLIISGSSAEVGSSNSMAIGSMQSARAIATRCCWPPES